MTSRERLTWTALTLVLALFGAAQWVRARSAELSCDFWHEAHDVCAETRDLINERWEQCETGRYRKGLR